MKEKQVYKKNLATSGQKFQKILFMASSSTYYEPNCGSTRLCDQNCGIQPANRQTHRHTDRQTQRRFHISQLTTEATHSEIFKPITYP